MSDDCNLLRRTFLFVGIALTLFGCFVAAIGIALPAWQKNIFEFEVVELAEFNAVHEHGIFYDCVRSEIVSLDKIRGVTKLSVRSKSFDYESYSREKVDTDHTNTVTRNMSNKESGSSEYGGEKEHRYGRTNHETTKRFDSAELERPPPPRTTSASNLGADAYSASRRCVSKFENAAESATWTMRMAVEEGDPTARELLLHRFLPQHKAVIFFFVFSVIFSLISVVVGSCSECFVPNGILHVISVAMAMCCSILGDVIFFVAANRSDNHNIYGVTHIYYQHLSYAFCVHVFGSAMLSAATFCALVAAYLLVRRECTTTKRKVLKKNTPYICSSMFTADKIASPIFGPHSASMSIGQGAASRGVSFDASITPPSAIASKRSSMNFYAGHEFLMPTASGPTFDVGPHLMPSASNFNYIDRHANFCIACNGVRPNYCTALKAFCANEDVPILRPQCQCEAFNNGGISSKKVSSVGLPPPPRSPSPSQLSVQSIATGPAVGQSQAQLRVHLGAQGGARKTK